MADIREIVAFSSDGEKILGVVIEHYTNPLDDFYVIYADYALHKSHDPDGESEIIIDNVIIPACDAALSDYRLKRQHLMDIDRFHREIGAMKEAISSKMNTDVFSDEGI